MKIKIYFEKNAESPPAGMFIRNLEELSMGGILIARFCDRDTYLPGVGKRVELSENVRVVSGGILGTSDFHGNRRITSNPNAATTAFVVDDIDPDLAERLAKKYPGWVILPTRG